MLLGIISDTHRHSWSINKASEKLMNSNMIIHLGDNVQDIKEIKKNYKGEIINVKGNCDFFNGVPSEKTIIVEGKKIFLTHGHNYEVKEGLLRLRYKALEVGADLVLYGHTHLSKIDFEDGMFFVNPGSAALSRDGFNSVATIEISGDRIIPSIIRI